LTLSAPLQWDQTTVNLLFVGAGVVSFFASYSIKYLTRCVSDTTLITLSLLMCAALSSRERVGALARACVRGALLV
jgi:hypothetical protein